MNKIFKSNVIKSNAIQRFKLHNRITDNKLSEPTKEAAEYMNNKHNVIRLQNYFCHKVALDAQLMNF